MGAAKLAGHALLAASIVLLWLSALGAGSELKLAGALAGLAHEILCSTLYLVEIRRALRPGVLEPLAYSGLASAALVLAVLGRRPAWLSLAVLVGGSLAAHRAAEYARSELGMYVSWKRGRRCLELGAEYEVDGNNYCYSYG